MTDLASLNHELVSVEFDAVVHLAALSHVVNPNPTDFYKTNVIGTNNLFDSILKRSKLPNKLIVASSALIYGKNASYLTSEIVSPQPQGHYAISKMAMEHVAHNYMDRLPIVLVRPFNYTGIFQPESFVIPKIISHFKTRQNSIELGNIDVEREFNDVRYICDVYLALLAYGEAGQTYNVCSGKGICLRELIKILSARIGYEIKVVQNTNLIRDNEVPLLTGDPAKLNALFNNYQIAPPRRSLEEVLMEMLLEKSMR